jgi:hypothetical protein
MANENVCGKSNEDKAIGEPADFKLFAGRQRARAAAAGKIDTKNFQSVCCFLRKAFHNALV